MKLLAIDTSTEQATVALAVNNEIYGEEQGGMRQHAQLLLPMVERLLAQAEMSISQLDAIVFGRGPGSFTGLRVACSVAKGMAYAHDLPLYPVSGLAAIAYEVSQQFPENVGTLAMIDARMHQVYWGYFTGNEFEAQEQVSAAADIRIPSVYQLTIAGVGLDPYVLQLPERIQSQITKRQQIFPTAKTMIHLVQSGHIKAMSAMEALPVYIRDNVTQGGDVRG